MSETNGSKLNALKQRFGLGAVEYSYESKRVGSVEVYTCTAVQTYNHNDVQPTVTRATGRSKNESKANALKSLLPEVEEICSYLTPFQSSDDADRSRSSGARDGDKRRNPKKKGIKRDEPQVELSSSPKSGQFVESGASFKIGAAQSTGGNDFERIAESFSVQIEQSRAAKDVVKTSLIERAIQDWYSREADPILSTFLGSLHQQPLNKDIKHELMIDLMLTFCGMERDGERGLRCVLLGLQILSDMCVKVGVTVLKDIERPNDATARTVSGNGDDSLQGGESVLSSDVSCSEDRSRLDTITRSVSDSSK
jgi:hypothetical protein